MSRAIIGLDDASGDGINFATHLVQMKRLRNRRHIKLRAAKKADRRARRKEKRRVSLSSRAILGGEK